MSYEGRGQYVHYKGGRYTAVGIGELESDRTTKFVVYVSHSEKHTADRESRGVDFILRPLNPEDAERIGGSDSWNEPALAAEDGERFKLVAKFVDHSPVMDKGDSYG